MELKEIFNQWLVFYDQFEVLVLMLMFINMVAGLLILFIRNRVTKLNKSTILASIRFLMRYVLYFSR